MLPEGEKILKRKSRFKSAKIENLVENLSPFIVQIKSYEGEHWETHAVEQIKEAISRYEADAGLLITTAEKTVKLQEAIDKLSSAIEKPVALLAGEDVARFVLKYYGDELLK
jgi:restriction endonuclease Mrr